MGSHVEEGFAEVPGGNVWYRRLDPGRGTPILILHGGPGCGYDYLEPLEQLASERPLVFFDQLGCGRSDKPADDALWRIERYVQEVDAVRDQLGLDSIHLFGHSWGGWLAIEYMLNDRAGVESLVLASTSASLQQVAEETGRLKATLPAEVRQILERFEEVGDYHHPEYEEAMMEFYRRFFCRLDPWPDALLRTLANVQDHPIPYETMQGTNEFTITGNLKNWNRESHLGEIGIPVLITCGRFDELGAMTAPGRQPELAHRISYRTVCCCAASGRDRPLHSPGHR